MTLNQRTPSNEAVNLRTNDEHHHKSMSRASSTKPSVINRQPVTPIEDKGTFSLKRNGSLPNNENITAYSVAEKHPTIMEMLNSRIRDCRRINSLLKSKNGEG